FLGGVDCLGPGVRVPAGDPGRPGQPGLDRDRQVPGRRHDRHLPGRDLPDPGGLRARPLQPAAHPHPDRRIAAALVHADRVRRHDGGPDPPVPGLHGADPDARDAPVLPVRGPLPAQRPARLAERADRIDPLTYVVGPMRHAVFSHLSFPPAFSKVLAPDITWGGWQVPLWLSLAMVAVMGLGLMAIAIAEFSKTE